VSEHFEAYGGKWPVHCVQGSDGARFHSRLHLPDSAVVISSGEGRTEQGYSAFDGRTPDGRSFLDDLRARGITRLYVGGLATDYCVRHSVLDALSAGLRVTLLNDAIAGIDPDTSAQALAEMRGQGADIAAGAGILTTAGPGHQGPTAEQ
jgi:nicotinamidase/pyrazinamidase